MKRLIVCLGLLFVLILTGSAQRRLLLQGVLKPAASASGPPTFFGSSSNPSDPGSVSGGGTNAVTPPSSMVSGDLVIMFGHYRGNDGAINIEETGGQVWNVRSALAEAASSFRIAWCEFNGTWSANPAMTNSGTANGFTASMHVFRPGNAAGGWDIDVAEAHSTYSTPPGTCLVTNASVTTLSANTVVFAVFASIDDNTWALNTAGWSQSIAQVRNSAGADSSGSFAYKVFPSAGNSGEIESQQTALGCDAGRVLTIAFKETP